MTIDYEGPVPVWRQIADVLREQITSGQIQPGRPIPSRRRLAQEHGVAEVTATKAVKLLKDQGYVRGTVGRGTFVTEPGRWPS